MKVKQITKKISAIILGISMMVSVTACGTDKATSVSELDLGKYVEAGDYKNMSVSVSTSLEVDQAYVTYLSNQVYSSAASYVEAEKMLKNRAVADDDMISLDYTGKKDGVAFDGGTAEGATLWIGSNTFIDGFESGLVGVKPGETVDLNLTFPEDYGSTDLAGAAVVFTVKVNGIIPESEILNAMFTSMSIGLNGAAFANQDELNQFCYDYLADSAQSDYDAELEEAIASALISGATFKKDFPETLIKAYQDKASDSLNAMAEYYGTDVDTFVSSYLNTTKDDYINSSSLEQLKMDALVSVIANKENMNLTEAQLDERIKEYAQSLGYEDASSLLESEKLDSYRLYFLEQDVLEYLKGIVTIN